MAIQYLADQSWLDLLFLTLPILVPFLISLYFLMTERAIPEPQVNPLPFHIHTAKARESMEEASEKNRHGNDDGGVDPRVLHRNTHRETSQWVHDARPRNDASNPSILRRQNPRSKSPLPFIDGVYTPDLLHRTRPKGQEVNKNNYQWFTRTPRNQTPDPTRPVLSPLQVYQWVNGRLPHTVDADVPENLNLDGDPWRPDGFRLPEAEDEEGRVQNERVSESESTDRSRKPSKIGVSNTSIPPPQRHVKPNLRGGSGGSESVPKNPARTRRTSEELREHVQRNRAETLASLQYHGKAEGRAREIAGLARQYPLDGEERRVRREAALRMQWRIHDRREGVRERWREVGGLWRMGRRC